MAETRLDVLLARAGENYAYPSSPDVRARVQTQIATTRRAGGVAHMRWYAVAAAIVIAAIATVAAIPASRSAVAHFFGVHGSKIVALPTPAPGTTATPFPTPQPIEHVAQPITMAEATDALGFAPALPGGVSPDHIYLVRFFETTPAVVLSYGEYDLWVLRPDDGGIFQKGEAGLSIDQPLVRGRPANWLSDGTHIVTYTNAQGTPAAGSQRTVTRNTLVWRTNTGFYRLETDLDEQSALALAETLP